MYARFSATAGTGTGLHRRARFGATRFNYHGPKVLCTVGGVARHRHFDRDGWSVSLRTRGQASTLTIQFFGFTPTVGQEIILGAGGLKNRLFRGTIVRRRQVHQRLQEGRVIWHCTALDWTYQLQDARVIKKYVNQSGTDIALDLIATYAPAGFTASVEPNLPTVDAIQFTKNTLPTCLQQLADRLGGYTFVDFEQVVHLFVAPFAHAPAKLTSTNRHVRDFSYESDIEDLRNRIWVEGLGASITAAAEAGSTTLPVDDTSAFASSGGPHWAKLEAQRITYIGVATQNGEGCVTDGVQLTAPTAPGAAQATGGVLATYQSGTLGVGNYQYKVTFVTADGESAGSPPGAMGIAQVNAPDLGTMAATSSASAGSLTADGNYGYTVAYVTSAGETPISTQELRRVGLLAGHTAVELTNIPVSPDGRVTARRIYRTLNLGFDPKLLATILNNTATTYLDTIADASLGGNPPAANTAGSGRGEVTGIAVGAAGTTQRKLYRTAVGGSAFKLVATINDNTTTTYADNTSDASLGADIPAGSQIGAAAGQTSLRLTDLSKVPASGWLRVGAQVIRYTARSAASGAGEVTGIPASGVGAIAAEIRAGTTVVVEPHLTGIPASGDGALAHAARVGETVHILARSDDATSQGNYRVRERFEQQRQLSRGEAAARAAAMLTLLKDARVSGWAVSTDPQLRAGRPWFISVAEWDLLNVTVTVHGVEIRPGGDWPHPLRTAQFGSRTLDDLYAELRAIKEGRLAT